MNLYNIITNTNISSYGKEGSKGGFKLIIIISYLVDIFYLINIIFNIDNRT